MNAKRMKWWEGDEGKGNPERGKGRRCMDLSGNTQKREKGHVPGEERQMGGIMMMGRIIMTGTTILGADTSSEPERATGGIMMTGSCFPGADS